MKLQIPYIEREGGGGGHSQLDRSRMRGDSLEELEQERSTVNGPPFPDPTEE